MYRRHWTGNQRLSCGWLLADYGERKKQKKKNVDTNWKYLAVRAAFSCLLRLYRSSLLNCVSARAVICCCRIWTYRNEKQERKRGLLENRTKTWNATSSDIKIDTKQENDKNEIFLSTTEIHFVNERVVFGFEKVDDTCVSVELLLQAGLTERELTLPQVVFKFSSAEWPNSCNTAAIEAGAIHRLSTPTMKTHTHKRRPFSLSFRFKCPTFSFSFSFTHLCVLDVNTRHVDNKQTEPDRWIDRARLLVLGDEQKTKWLTETWRSCWKGVADVAARQRLARRVWENCTQPDHAQTKAVILFFSSSNKSNIKH